MIKLENKINAMVSNTAKLDGFTAGEAMEYLAVMYINNQIRIPKYGTSVLEGKKCTKCKVFKALDQYSKNAAKLCRRQSQCKACYKEYRDSRK